MDTDTSNCHMKCLLAGGILGLGVLILLLLATSMGFFMSLVLGIVIAILATIVMRMVLCTSEASIGAKPVSDTTAASSAPVSPAQSPMPEPAPAADPALEPAPDRDPVAEAPEASPQPEPEAEAEPEPQPEPEPEPEPAPVPQAAPEPAEGAAVQPVAMDAAREGGPDDLKKIKGVGPKLEQLLHSLGIYHYDQIAAWGPAEVAWMDDNLQGFRGRVTRDNWVEQAGLLAAGGETDFSRKVDEGDVY